MAVQARTLPETLALASRDGRICPKPGAWARLYELMPATRRDSYGAIPPEPFSLESWHGTDEDAKRHRFVEHLEWARAHAALDAVHEFLASLADAEWHHAGD